MFFGGLHLSSEGGRKIRFIVFVTVVIIVTVVVVTVISNVN